MQKFEVLTVFSLPEVKIFQLAPIAGSWWYVSFRQPI